MENEKSTIDEQLAEEQRKFDARLAAEAKATRKAEGVKVTPKPQKVVIPPKMQKHYVGEVAHSHFQETETEIIEVPCVYVQHFVNDRKGFSINGRRFQGKVVVPQCVANTLSEMENKHREMERGVFEDRGRQLNYGEIRG